MDCKAPHHARSRTFLLLAPLLAATLAGCQQGQPPTAARTLYLNGKIHSQDGQRQVAEAMVVSGDQFLYVGNRQGAEALSTPDTQVVNLQGKMVLPGLHDNHIHLLGTVALDMCDLDGKPVDLGELAAKVKRCLPRYAPKAGDWLVINQWSPYEGRCFLNRCSLNGTN